jgi:hypothetical protein
MVLFIGLFSTAVIFYAAGFFDSKEITDKVKLIWGRVPGPRQKR